MDTMIIFVVVFFLLLGQKKIYNLFFFVDWFIKK